MRYFITIICCCFCTGLLRFAARAQDSTSAADTLKQYVADLQKNPGDDALREKIIRLALTLNPKPAVPDDAITHEGAAEYAFKNAKANSDYSDAAKEYEKALLAAPWVAADYFNCGFAHEKAGELKDAIRNYSFYVFDETNADEIQSAKKHIGGLQYAQQKIDDQQQQQAQAVQAQHDAEAQAEQARQAAQLQAQQTWQAQQARDEELTKKLEGVWRVTGGSGYNKDRFRTWHTLFKVQGGQLNVRQFFDKALNPFTGEGKINEITVPLLGHVAQYPDTLKLGIVEQWQISDDFSTMTFSQRDNGGGVTYVYTRVDDPRLISPMFK